MSGTPVQTKNFLNSSWSSPLAITMDSNISPGASVIVMFTMSGNGTTRVSGVTVAGTAATKIYDTDNAANTNHIEYWLAEGVVGGSAALSIAAGAGSAFRINGTVLEFNGLVTTPLDRFGEDVRGTASTSVTATANAVSSTADSVLLAVVATNNNNLTTLTGPAGYTALFSKLDGGAGHGGAGFYKVETVAEQEAAAFSGFSSTTVMAAIITLKVGAPTPTISGTSTSSPTHGGSMTVTGINFGATQGTKTLKVGGTVCTPSAWSNASITVAVDRGLNKYGSALNVEVWDGTLLSNSFAISGIQPPAGWSYVNIVSVSGTGLSSLPALAAGDQVAYQTTGTPSGVVVVYADLDYMVSEFVTSFQCEGWTPTDGWGATATKSIGSPPSSGARRRRSLYGSLAHSFKL